MEIENRTTTYLIFYSRAGNRQRTSVVGVEKEEDLVNIIRTTFKGRFKRPLALSPKDGVSIQVKRLDHVRKSISLVLITRIYNKSVRNARIDLEQAIRRTQ